MPLRSTPPSPRVLRERGVLVPPSNIELRLVSTVQTDADNEETLDGFEHAANAVAPVLTR